MSTERAELNVHNQVSKRSWAGQVIGHLGDFREGTLLLTIIIISVLMSYVSSAFFTVGNIKTTLVGVATDGIVVTGMTIALISGGFDLSVGSVAALAGVVIGALFLAGSNIWLAVILGIAVAVLCGLINSFFITKIGLSPFITTLAMMGIARGASFIITKGMPLPLYSMPEQFKKLGGGELFGIPNIVIIFLIFALLGDFLLRRSVIFRKVFYVGSNEKAAMVSGIAVKRVKMGVFALTAFTAGVAGALSIARFGVAPPTYGMGLELSAISAAVIGGASLNGGEGTVFGAVLGVILLGIINSSLVLLDVSVYWQQLISSLILLSAVSLDYISHKRRLSKAIKG